MCRPRTFCPHCPVDIDGVDVLKNEGITVNGCESSVTSEGTERMREERNGAF
jgi:hypothetical protein